MFAFLQPQKRILLLSRGNAYSSATIARIANTDTQFSPVAMYYLDEKTNTPYLIQAHIGIEVVVDRFADYFKDGKLRSSVFRFEDTDLAKKAAEWTYDAMLTEMFRWMEDYGYKFHARFKESAITVLSYAARRTPFVSSALNEKFPINMAKNTLEEKRFINDNHGVYPTFTQRTQMLEEIRREDVSNGEIFHKAFHP